MDRRRKSRAMQRVSDTINQALVLADNAIQSVARLVNAMEKINEPDTPLLNVNVRLQNQLDIESTKTVIDDLGRIARSLSDLHERTTEQEEERKDQ